MNLFQVAHKDGLILNLQSELDATQQEFENTVEELAQKDEELSKLKSLVRETQTELKEVKSDREERIAKVCCTYVQLLAKKIRASHIRLGSHCSAYELIRFCRYLSTVHTPPFLCKNPDKNIRFCRLTVLTVA